MNFVRPPLKKCHLYIYSPLSVLLSMFVSLVSSLETIWTNIALAELFPVIIEPRNFNSLSITGSIGISLRSSSLRLNFTFLTFQFSMERNLHFFGFSNRPMDFILSSMSVTRFWCMVLFLVIRLKSSSNGVVITFSEPFSLVRSEYPCVSWCFFMYGTMGLKIIRKIIPLNESP